MNKYTKVVISGQFMGNILYFIDPKKYIEWESEADVINNIYAHIKGRYELDYNTDIEITNLSLDFTELLSEWRKLKGYE